MLTHRHPKIHNSGIQHKAGQVRRRLPGSVLVVCGICPRSGSPNSRRMLHLWRKPQLLIVLCLVDSSCQQARPWTSVKLLARLCTRDPSTKSPKSTRLTGRNT